VDIAIKKHADGGSTLTCARDDGSTTWQNHPGQRGFFFALHDLTHYVVETTLGLDEGFYGLVAAGWEIEDTTGKGSRGPLPHQTLQVEHLVGLLDQERAGAAVWTARDINEQAGVYFEQAGRPAPPPIDDASLNRIRERTRDLFGEWNRLPAGGTLKLRFPPD